MLKVRLCFDDDGQPCEPKSDQEIRDVLSNPKALTWIDVDRDHLDSLKRFSDVIHLHPLAIEDATTPHQRPITSRYGETIFVLFYELARESNDTIHAYPYSFFVGSNYVVTIRDIARSTLDGVAKRWHEFSEQVQNRNSGFLLYAMLDAIVDEYFPIIDSLGDRIEDLEEVIVNARNFTPQRQVVGIRKELFVIRRVLSPSREALNELIRRDTPLIDEETITYMHDVYDHVLRVLDWLDAYRDMASTLFDMQLAMSSHRLDEIMRTLTVASIILMVASLIAGIYGMNFKVMPELHWVLGYPMALGMMMLTGVLLALYFRHRRWL
ncbi:MAG TPA: magnesium/cobalt transporter CorA [Thermomicrobiales bacterium]|nr:magnesium/cobalt transporter CorA [Thermomicrobiales bacterium]